MGLLESDNWGKVKPLLAVTCNGGELVRALSRSAEYRIAGYSRSIWERRFDSPVGPHWPRVHSVLAIHGY